VTAFSGRDGGKVIHLSTLDAKGFLLAAPPVLVSIGKTSYRFSFTEVEERVQGVPVRAVGVPVDLEQNELEDLGRTIAGEALWSSPTESAPQRIPHR